MANLNGKVIEIEGVKYTLVECETEKKNKAIISMETPFGVLQTVCDRSELDADGEGVFDVDGKKVKVEFVSESDLKEKLGKPLSELDVDDIIKMILDIM